LFPSIADILFISLLLYLCLFEGKRLLNDGDTGYHIRAGEFILDSFTVPRYDMFSFISPALPWTAHEWLAEIIMALVHRAGGLTGVVVFFALLIAGTFHLYFKTLRRENGNIYIAILLMIMVIATSKIHLLARPHIFSLTIMVAWYFLLDSYQYQDRDRLYILPFIMLLWVNLHGGYVVGLFLIGVYLLGNLVQLFTPQSELRQQAVTKAKKLTLILFTCLAACLVNPTGYHILLFPFKLVSDTYIMDHVHEFMSPNFHEPFYFKYMLLGMIILFAATREKLNVIELVLIVFFVNMSLYSVRYIPLFAIFSAPIILRRCDSQVAQWSNRPVNFLKRSAERVASMDASARGLVWPAAAISLVAVMAASGRTAFTFDEKTKPVAAVRFLLTEKISGNMFNNDEFGDYVIYSSYPHYKVFIDGRSDMYGSKQLKEYFSVINFERGWEDILERYNIDWILYNSDSMFTRHLLKNSDWRLIYADNTSSIFVKNIPKYQALIEKYPDVKPAVPEDKSTATAQVNPHS